MRYLFLGLKDIAEGRGTFALAELANEMTRLNGAAFLAASALLGLAAAGYGIYKIVEYAHDAELAQRKLEEGFHELTSAIENSNDAIQVTNDKLENQIANI